MDGRQGQQLPEGIEAMPPGAALAAALEVDATSLSSYDLPRYVAARKRQLSHEEALFAEAARECALAAPEHPSEFAPGPLLDPSVPPRREQYGTWAADELRVVLRSSRTAVWKVLGLAEDAMVRLPALMPVWRTGVLDQDRVRIFCSWTSALSQEHARSVVDVLLPEAPQLTLRALIERIQEVAKGLDPEWAAKLYEAARRQRRVRARCTEEGTANLSGLDLPLDGTARSVAWVTLLAARARAAGHPGLIDTIKADIFLALLSPQMIGKSDAEVVAAVVAAARPDDPPGPPAPDPADAPPDPADDEADGATPGPAPAGPVPNGPTPDGPTPDGPTPDGPTPDGPTPDGPTPDGPVPDSPAPEGPTPSDPRAGEPVADGDPAGHPDAGHDDEPGDEPGDGGTAGAGERSARRVRCPRQARIELRVGLRTLLGLDEKPARLPGWGVVHAPLAREIARDHHGAEWRVAVHDPDGALSAALLARRRPDLPRTVPDDHSESHGSSVGLARPVVEMHVEESVLAALDPAAFPAWSAVLHDLQSQLWGWQRARAEDASAREAEAAAVRAAEDAAARAAEEAAAREAEEAVTRTARAVATGSGREPAAVSARDDGRRTPSPAHPVIDVDPELLERVAARQRARAQEAARRFPGAALSRWVEMRDRFCAHPTCGATALACDLDHTLAVVAEHGFTESGNLGPGCGHDHALKHATWTLRQPRPGHFTWTSPSGHSYDRTPPSVVPDVPDPSPPAQQSRTDAQTHADDGPTWDRPPYEGGPSTTEGPNGSSTTSPGRPDDPPPF